MVAYRGGSAPPTITPTIAPTITWHAQVVVPDGRLAISGGGTTTTGAARRDQGGPDMATKSTSRLAFWLLVIVTLLTSVGWWAN